jgi:guanylate kinase
MELADGQFADAHLYDYIVVNDQLETAVSVLQGIVLAELHRCPRRRSALHRVGASGA